MEDYQYVIWHHVKSSTISDLSEVVGICENWDEAKRVVQALNETDEDRREWTRKDNYWYESFRVLTLKNVVEV